MAINIVIYNDNICIIIMIYLNLYIFIIATLRLTK